MLNHVSKRHHCWDPVAREQCKPSNLLNVICKPLKGIEFPNQHPYLSGTFVDDVQIVASASRWRLCIKQGYIQQHMTLVSIVWAMILSQYPERFMRKFQLTHVINLLCTFEWCCMQIIRINNYKPCSCKDFSRVYVCVSESVCGCATVYNINRFVHTGGCLHFDVLVDEILWPLSVGNQTKHTVWLVLFSSGYIFQFSTHTC